MGQSSVTNLALDEGRFLDLLSKLVALGPRLQNSPSAGLVPEERLAAELVLAALRPHLESGFVRAKLLFGAGQEARPNLVLSIPGTGSGSVGLVGAHFDVVPADRESEGWERDPFALHVGESGLLYGRGVTDCLGHVALLAELVARLAETGTRPKRTVEIVMISNEEEAPLPEIGLDYAVSAGALDSLKDGTLYWLDSADFGPTVGTGGMAMWRLVVQGVGGHSGMTQNCVNALELAMAASRSLADWFERHFPAHEDEARWGFLSPSTLKATVVHVANDKITKIPGSAVIEGDIRLTPFYDMREAIEGAERFVSELDRLIEAGDAPQGFPRTRTVSGERGSLKLERIGRTIDGIACNLGSPGLAALAEAIRGARPGEEPVPYSMTGSLPLVRDLQRAGFDVQITGFGRARYYHAPNEQAELEHFRQGFEILTRLLEL
jgi:acetylornithine deacetylase/succinyl-diaminopimelate desuccinylase-like protein